ncbi:AMP-binding protein [Dactylosporangium sp. CA-092794]|uniref:AMP-binding protein n=1 Tax=Dactylosporangium sp. CA-092794 TaxID=3239929 RepID=UPI003D91D9C8
MSGLVDAVPYPADFARRYRDAGLWGRRTIGAELHATALRHPDVEAVVTAERRVTYGELDRRSDAIAAELVHHGLRTGDAVILQLGNTVEAIEAFYGLLKMGAVPICSLVPFRHHEIDAIATIAGARAHLVQADIPGRDLLAFAAEVRSSVATMELTFSVRGGDGAAIRLDTAPARDRAPEPPAIDAEDVALLQLSGGTSGTPKLIPHLHCSYWYYGRASAQRWDYRAGDRVAHFLPVFHNSGLHAGLFAAHSVGATLVLSVWSPAAVLDTLRAERITHFGTLTSLITEICDDPAFAAATATLRRLSLALPRVPEELFDRLDTEAYRVCQFYGMSEGFSTSMPADAPVAMRRETVGYPLSELDEFLVADPMTGAPADDAVGELCVRGPYTLRGYYRAEDHNARAFTPDGFLRTGDLARVITIDGRRCLRIEGRVKDLVSRGGEKINAEEIEELLRQHPGIADAALVGLPDARLGQRACVFVIAAPGATPTLDSVTDFLSQRDVARFKWPERLEVIDEFPRTPVGKLAKRLLVERLASGSEVL